MAKRKSGGGTTPLFHELLKRRHPRLFLPKYLAEEAEKFPVSADELARVSAVLTKWADAAALGHLDKKETEIDGDFLEKIFGDALGYKSISESPNDYHRKKNPTVQGAGIADGSLGLFISDKDVAPAVIIELKGATADLDHDKFNGRTPVQQCWDYLNQLPDTQWGIVSNYVSIRLYHKGSPARAYEEFTVADFRDPERVKQFYYVFEKNGLVGTKVSKPRVLKLLTRTQNQQREVGDKLYAYYAQQRERLIADLIRLRNLSQDDAIRAAQKLLDRVVFIAFCEDRGLLPERLLLETWKHVPPLSRAGRRWQNFVDLFHFIDKGHEGLELPTGYNGGLFAHDPVVDDLTLDGDPWTEIFKDIGEYDFSEGGEINVEVLGHLFERSITELEKRRVVGLFGEQAERAVAQMPKSAERKRFGIYYTPPQFTQLIVEETLGKLIEERVDSIPDLRARIAALRKIKVVDPACGSGAFLIAAYERLEHAYEEVARQLRVGGHLQEALNLTNEFPDYILFDNLHGVDLSAEAVEITQLALWIRSARKGRALTDLSNNIKRGNSLIKDKSVHPEAFDWQAEFAGVFKAGGFDAVIGNPPWERMKVQEREFFSLVAPEIATAVNAATRRKLIAAVEADNPELWQRYTTAQKNAESTLAHVRSEDAGFPLTGRGDVNTYMLFAELARGIVAPTGRVGLLVPSGIATDNTTKDFFADTVESKTLIGLYDFENKRPWFEDVHRSFKFSVLLLGGAESTASATDFVFFARDFEDLSDKDRHIELSPKDLKLLNPNTRTCPIFRTRRDAELTKRVYRRVPVLIDESRKSGGNPWGVSFCRMFDQTNDAGEFTSGEKLKADGYKLNGNRWTRKKEECLPLYEAKMIQAFDHRAAGVRIAAGNWMRQGQAEDSTYVDHQNEEFVVQPRYWVNAEKVREIAGRNVAMLAYKDVTSATNQRTMIAAMIPEAAVVNSAPFVLTGRTEVAQGKITARRELCLLANFNSFIYDFVARQKVGGLHLNFFIVEQLPTLPPDAYDEKCPWAKSRKLEDWIADRVLKLTCTANDMLPLAKAAGFKQGVHKWMEDERAQLRAELDAAYFRLYGLSDDDVEYILGTFQGVVKEDKTHGGVGPTRARIREALRELSA